MCLSYFVTFKLFKSRNKVYFAERAENRNKQKNVGQNIILKNGNYRYHSSCWELKTDQQVP